MADVAHLLQSESDSEDGRAAPEQQTSDSESDNDQDDFKENNNVLLESQQDSDDDEEEWCEHLDASDPEEVRHILRKKLRCCTCRKKAHFSCIQKVCVTKTSSSCCRDVSHIFSHMATNDHPVIIHHKLRVILCTRCNVRTSIRQFLRHFGVATDFMLGEEMQQRSIELQALCGYVNFGNTCYMNAVFQLLGHCSPFAEYMTSFEPPSGWGNYPVTGRNTTMQLAVDMRLMWGALPVPFISPWKIIYCIRSQLPGFESFQQQDATEFLRSLFDIIDRELRVFANQVAYNQIPDFNFVDDIDEFENEARRTIISDLFQGTLENQIQCHTCGFQSRTYETFLDLSVPIVAEEEEFYTFTEPETKDLPDTDDVIGEDGALDPGYAVHQRSKNKTSLSDCLDRFFQNSTLTGENQYSCTKCDTHVDATKSTKATILPEVILIQLKRFRHTMYGTRKVDKIVEFPVYSMDFDRWTTNEQRARYELVGFIVHEGTSVEYGHYVTFARHEQDKMWYKFDDLNTQRCEINRVAMEQPYILMFRRQGEVKNDVGTSDQQEEPVQEVFCERFMEQCPGIWEVIQEALENDTAENTESVRNANKEVTLEQRGNPLPQVSAEYIYTTLNNMMTEIQDSMKMKPSRKSSNTRSPDNSFEAVCKLIGAIEKWFKIMTKKRWVERQMIQFERFNAFQSTQADVEQNSEQSADQNTELEDY